MIVINEDYIVDVDSLQYTLKRKGVGKSKKGETIETTRTVGYFRDLRACIKASAEDSKKELFKNNDYSLNEAIAKIQEINDTFSDLLNKAIKKVED